MLQDNYILDPDKIQTFEKALDDPYSCIASLGDLTLFEFFQVFWSEVSDDKLKLNWHIEYLCGELEKVAERVGANLPKESDVIINIPPGTSKPVWEEMPVLMHDGSYKPLKNVVVGDFVINKNGEPTKVTGVHVQGELPSLRIKTNGGRNLYMAYDHPVLTTKGWKNAEDIIIGDYVALMHTQKIEDTSDRTIDEFKLAGYLIGDGSVNYGECSITGKTIDYLNDFIDCATNMEFDHHIYLDKRNGVTKISLKERADKRALSDKGKFIGMGRGYKDPSGPRKWVRDVGIAGLSSKTKHVPDFVFKGSDEKIAAFLATYFQCDGTISYKHTSKRNIVVSATTISERLVYDLQRLFLRIGVPMKVRKRITKNGFTYNRDLKNYVSYTVETYDQDAVSLFLEKIPITGYKKEKLVGFVPQKRTFPQKYWPDEVVEIEKVNALPCRCLSVKEGRSFIVDGVVVHNTMLVSVMFPVWCWTKWYWMKFITGSYSDALALESAEKSRDIMRSDKFRTLYPDITIKEDKDTKSNYRIAKILRNERGRAIKTVFGGGRYSTSVGGTITGFHGHINIWDDPINPKQAASEQQLLNANNWVDQSASTRKADKAVTVTLMIMQRLHQDDPSGHTLAKADKKIKHICLPGEIRNFKPYLNPPELEKYYVDDLLDPARLNWDTLKEMEADLGQYGFAGQVGQHPVPPGGGMFKVEHFQIIQQLPNEIHQVQTLRYWDKAGSTNTGCFTVGVKMMKLKNNQIVILDVKRGQWAAEKREQIIKETAIADGGKVHVWLEQEPGSGGLESAQATIRNLSGFMVFKDKPNGQDGDKIRRADPYSVQVNNGNVLLLQGLWNKEFIEEHRFFPFGKYKDQVDASAAGFNQLHKRKIAGRYI